MMAQARPSEARPALGTYMLHNSALYGSHHVYNYEYMLCCVVVVKDVGVADEVGRRKRTFGSCR